MERMDRIVASVIFGIGVLHCGVTFVIVETAGGEVSFWFFSGGLAMIYAATLNLLRVRYAGVAPGLRRACLAVNLSLLSFILAYAASKGMRIFRNPGAVLLVASVLAATAFSMLPFPSRERSTEYGRRLL